MELNDNFKSKYVNLSFQCSGDLFLNDVKESGVAFYVRVLDSGYILGNMFAGINDIHTLDNDGNRFRLKGMIENDLTIEILDISFYSVQPNNESRPEIYFLEFTCNKIVILDSKRKPQNETLLFHFEILNLYTDLEIHIDETQCGKIWSKSVMSGDELMLYKQSYTNKVTKSLFLSVGKYESIDEAIRIAKDELSKVLELTSLALSAENTWSYFKMYLGTYKPENFVYSEIIKRFPKTPDSHPLLDSSRLNEYLNKALSHYDDEINKRYNFSLALKWYLDSISTRLDVNRFNSASIAFECIINKYFHSLNDENVLPDDIFATLLKNLSQTIDRELKDKVDSNTIQNIKNAIKYSNRKSYRNKAKKLLKELGLPKHIDSLTSIITIRDNITHTGRYYETETNSEVSDNYFKLVKILRDIFFRILNCKEFD